MFEAILRDASPLGLYAEEIDAATRLQLGNFRRRSRTLGSSARPRRWPMPASRAVSPPNTATPSRPRGPAPASPPRPPASTSTN